MDKNKELYRCFIAIEVPGPIKEKLSAIQERLKKWPARVNWVTQENFHLTLKFLGDVSAQKLSEVMVLLGRIVCNHKGWEVNLRGLGAFPHLGRPKVVWAGIEDPAGELVRLRDHIENEFEKAGFVKEGKRFSPHLTLGRVKETPVSAGLVEVMKLVPDFSYRIPVEQIKLMRSRLTPSGAEYSCIRSFNLQEH